MIHSMTGYGLATRQAPLTDAHGVPTGRTASVSVEFRTVNSRFLDLFFRAAVFQNNNHGGFLLLNWRHE